MFKRSCIALLLVLALLCQTAVFASADTTTPLIQLPVSVKVVEKEAFARSGAQVVVITSSVEKIESKAFANCRRLQEVVLPNHDVKIAEDAFDGCGDIEFHAFAGTKNETWVLAHGFRCTVEDANLLTQASAMLTKFGIPASNLQSDEDYSTCCLIAKMKENRLPDISKFAPSTIIQAGRNRFFIQFDTPADTENCYHFLEDHSDVSFVEVDSYRSAINNDIVSQQSIVTGWDNDDPMGFAAYSAFVKSESSKSTVIAVLDSGFPSNSAYDSKMLSSKGKSFTRDGNSWNYDGCNHGRLVAAVIADCIGDAGVKILPIRVADSQGRVDTISLLLGLEYAKQQGASFINMSLDFNDASVTSEALSEAITNASATVVVAAGNFAGSRMNRFPANHPSVIAVSAVDNGCSLASYSSYDAHYAAPGSVSGIGLTKSGTSFAAPMIASALALVSLDPNHTVTDLQSVCERVAQTTYGMPVVGKLARITPTGITISNVPDIMLYDDFIIPECKVLPEKATDKTFVCKSSNENVLAVTKNTNGTILLRAVGKGTATLTVYSSADDTVTSSKEVTVVKPVTKVTIQNGSSGTIYLSHTLKLTAAVEPQDASNTAVKFTSSNSSVATIDEAGNVTPLKTGTTTLSAVAQDGYGAMATYSLTVGDRPPIESITVTSSVTTMGVGSTLQLAATVLPADAYQEVTWTSLFPDLATIDADSGLVTAKAAGTAMFKVKSLHEEKEAYYQVTIKDVASSITITAPKTTINQEETVQLTATVTPSDALDKSIVWSSKNTAVATVSSSGVVTGITDGEATIEAKSGSNSAVFSNITIKVVGTFTVRFNTNASDGNPAVSPASLTAHVGKALGTLPTPTRDYYDFRGWYTNSAGTGEVVTASTVYNTPADVTLYASWALKAEQGWVTESQVPANATVTRTSWSYRESTESTESSMSGWTASGNYWKQTGSGSTNYASFPSGYNTSNYYYTSFAKSAYSAYDNGSTKRDVSNAHAGWVYWHWAYNAKYASVTNRTISSRKGSFNADGSSGGYAYQYFYAMASPVDCPYLDKYYCCSRNERSYNCASIINSFASSNDKTSSTSGLNNNRFFRFEYFTSSYTDYQKIYQYYRDLNYQDTEPSGSNISNKVKYVMYRVK